VAPDLFVFGDKRRVVHGRVRHDQPIEWVSHPFLVEGLFDACRKRQVAYR
jgi:hypothetical protein